MQLRWVWGQAPGEGGESQLACQAALKTAQSLEEHMFVPSAWEPYASGALGGSREQGLLGGGTGTWRPRGALPRTEEQP